MSALLCGRSSGANSCCCRTSVVFVVGADRQPFLFRSFRDLFFKLSSLILNFVY